MIEVPLHCHKDGTAQERTLSFPSSNENLYLLSFSQDKFRSCYNIPTALLEVSVFLTLRMLTK